MGCAYGCYRLQSPERLVVPINLGVCHFQGVGLWLCLLMLTFLCSAFRVVLIY